MFSESPELYDLIYGSFKDYEAEAAQVADLLGRVAPDAKTVLDVGCGTGEHARILRAAHGYEVHGLDIEPGFVELARQKVPESRFWAGDMAGFSLGTTFDAVICLFSSIGYVGSTERLVVALESFRAHLNPGGVAVVEPWFEPQAWHPGRVYVHRSESDSLHIVRMSHSDVRDRVSLLEFHYLIGTEKGVEHRTEHHDLALFTREEMMRAFGAAGFEEVAHDPKGLIGRGLYTARAPVPGV